MVIPKAATSLVVVVALLGPGRVLADEQALTEQLLVETDRPWAQGVSLEERRAANELFEKGNSLLRDSVFVQASDTYRQALTRWDHPGIRYNLALALLNLDQPIEVLQHLEAAMRYGVEPLDAQKFETARHLKTSLERQLTRVEIRCDVPDATVSMDGRVMFVGPDHYEGWMRPGAYSLSASKAGYVRTEKPLTLVAGQKEVLRLELHSPEELLRYRRRWPAWKPWAVMGTGAAVAAGGGLFYRRSSQTYREFDTAVVTCGGCMANPRLLGIHSRAGTLQRVAISMYALGGGLLATGAVLAYINRLQPYQIDPNEVEGAMKMSVAPVLGGDTTGLLTTFRF